MTDLTATPTTPSALHPADLARLDEAVALMRAAPPASALVPGLAAGGSAVAGACRVHHAAVAVFPPSLEALGAHLRERGLDPGEPTPSVVVRDRLGRRHRQPAHSLEVHIVRVPVGEREVEVFVLPVPPGSPLEAIAEGERERGDETHLAVAVEARDEVALHALRSMLADDGTMQADGGGFNRRERSTVLYFRDPHAADPFRRRLELLVEGTHASVLDAHRRASHEPARRLLERLTGAWATQAIAVAAELRLADVLGASPGTTTEALADATGCRADSLGRLLRYLVDLGLLVPAGDGHALTEAGRLLRSDAEPSMRPLALLYGGPFYESFGELLHAVRTGEDAFEHHFGRHHFAYFAERPALAELFDEAMASSASLFGGVAEVVDLGLVETVVDVGGGNGELLTRILGAAPEVRGVLLERPHALEAARERLEAAGCADRCELVPGDFTEAVPAGGDLYLLSRVLHDWDDDRCRVILRRCAEAMPDHALLLIAERLLPEDGSPSLAVPWDVHMLCNVGGRERTAAHFGRLLAEAGLEITARHELPLDVAVLAASRAERP